MYNLLKKAFTDIKNLKSSKQTKKWGGVYENIHHLKEVVH